MPTQKNVLIENGILRGYLPDKLSSRLLRTGVTGNGRRESYQHIPMPRMTNTFMLAGESDPAEIIRSVPRGLYCTTFGGGQVDITSGNFVFSATESYLIEDGKLTRPVKGATLIGNGPEALKYVSMVGNDLQLDEGIGICGKEGQSVPVGVGHPDGQDRQDDRGRDGLVMMLDMRCRRPSAWRWSRARPTPSARSPRATSSRRRCACANWRL